MFTVYIKELIELLRDKKTLFFVIALPLILFPVLFGLMAVLVSNIAMDEQQKVLRYSVINAEQAPLFSEDMFYHRDFNQLSLSFTDDEAIKQAIQKNEVDVVIKIPENFAQQLSENEQSQWQVFFNNASQINFVKQKVNKVFSRYTEQLQLKQLSQLNISKAQFHYLKSPVDLVVVNTADQRENLGEKIGGILPYLMIILCLTGAMYPAIDLGAGEKERGTLETLLLTPTSRLSIVLGKFLVIMTTGIISALITLFSLGFWGYIVGEIMHIEMISTAITTVGFEGLLLMLFMLIPLSAIFAAILLSISIYARSYKEAQNYMGPVSILGFMPVMVAMLPGIKLNWVWAMVPISNVALAIKEVLKGTIDYAMLLTILGSSSLFAVLSIIFCIHWFNKESVLFR